MSKQSSRKSLLDAYQAAHPGPAVPRDFVREKILADLHNKRPTSQRTLAPSSRGSTRRAASLTARSAISQIEPEPDKGLQGFRLSTAVIREKRAPAGQTVERVLSERIQAGLCDTRAMSTPESGAYPDYYASYRPRMRLAVSRRLTADQEAQGRQIAAQMRHRFFVAGMAPNQRPQRPNPGGRSVVTDALERAGAEMCLRIHQM